MTEGSLRTFDECLVNISNSKGCFVRINDVVVDDRCDMNIDIISGHADLGRHFNNLNPDIYMLQSFA